MLDNIDTTYKQVFRHQIWGYFVADMDGLLKSDSTPAVSASLLILSVMDWMASHYYGIGVRAPSASEAGELLSQYFSQDELLFKDVKFSEKFYQVFRHGLVHTLLPKGAGLNFVNEPYYNLLDISERPVLLALSDNQPVLYVRHLYVLTIKALRRYENELGIDIEVNRNFMKTHNSIVSDGEKNSADLLKLAPNDYIKQITPMHGMIM